MSDHRFDYRYADGMTLRPAPHRAEATWRRLRENLYSPFMAIPASWEDTPQTRLLDDHMWEGDPLIDDVVAMFERLGTKPARALFEQALTRGIGSVEDPPAELVALFAQVDRSPDWFDPAVAERGRQALSRTTGVAKLSAYSFGVFGTAMEEDVSAATGATGRLVRNPVLRAVESLQYFEQVTYRGVLERNSPMFHTVIRVRLMHGLVRRGLRRRWGAENFARRGMPISNTNLAAGSAWFSSMPPLIDHFLGRPVKLADLDDITIHWGYMLYLFGTAERIIPKTGMESIHLANHVFASAGSPAQWRPELAEALLVPFTDSVGTLGGKLSLRAFLGAAGMTLGTEAMAEFVAGTKFEQIDVRRCVRVYETAARGAARAACAKDRAVARGLLSPRATEADPWFVRNSKVIRRWAAKNGVHVTPYTHHDGSTAGAAFDRQSA